MRSAVALAMAAVLLAGSTFAEIAAGKAALPAFGDTGSTATGGRGVVIDGDISQFAMSQCPVSIMEHLNSLGIIFAQGTGVRRDSKQALRLFALSASYGYPLAMINLATMYGRGIGVKRDRAVAYGWLRAAIVFVADDQTLDVAVSQLAIAASKMGVRRVRKGNRIARDIVVALREGTDGNAVAGSGAPCISLANLHMGLVEGPHGAPAK
jgi:TPR repeat protein